MSKAWLPLAFIALVVLLAAGLRLNPREVPSPLIGKPAPAFELPLLAQPDKRFSEIVRRALAGEEIRLKKGDGTQFIWAGDLARLYQAVLDSNRSREVYFGLATPFVSWQAVAEEAVRLAGSKSKVVVEGEPGAPCLFDLSKIREHFGLEFSSAAHITAHLQYLMQRA